MPQPEPQVMNFQMAPSPWGAALDSYAQMKKAQGQGIDNQLNKAKVPYAAQQEQEALKKAILANQQQEAQQPYWDQNYANDAYMKQIERQFAPRAAETDIRYKEGLAASSMLNARVGELNYELALARTPAELAKLEAERESTLMEMAMVKEWMKRNGLGAGQSISGNPENMNMNQPADRTQQNPQAPMDFSSAIGKALGVKMPGQSMGQGSMNEQPQATPSAKTFEDYLNPVQSINPADSYMDKVGERFLSQADLAGLKAASAARAEGQVKSYQKNMDSLGERASSAQELNTDLEAMMNVWKTIPEAQKGAAFGQMKALNQNAKLFESLQSASVLKELESQKGTASEGDREEIKRKFGDRTFNDKSFEELMIIRKLIDDRVIEKQEKFSNHPDVPYEKLESAWNKMLKEKSIFRDPLYLEFKYRQSTKNMTDEQAAQEYEKLLIQERM